MKQNSKATKYRSIKRELSRDDMIHEIEKANSQISLQNEMIEYWSNKKENNLNRTDSFIFMVSGFNKIDDYLLDCNKRIVYNQDKIKDLKERLKKDVDTEWNIIVFYK